MMHMMWIFHHFYALLIVILFCIVSLRHLNKIEGLNPPPYSYLSGWKEPITFQNRSGILRRPFVNRKLAAMR